MDKNNGAYTIHVYDKNGNLDEKSELNCQTFVDLATAKKMAMEYLSNNGGIIDISYDSEDSDDPDFIWSSEHDLELRLKILEDKIEKSRMPSGGILRLILGQKRTIPTLMKTTLPRKLSMKLLTFLLIKERIES